MATVAAIVVGACAGGYRPGTTIPAVAPEAIDHTLYLIGDAGTPRPPLDPVLEALRSSAAGQPERSTVVFLGDNIYPLGMPEPGAPGRPEAERRLAAQIDAVPPGTRGVFVMGNHDWVRGRDGGWEAVRRQAAFIADAAREGVLVLPAPGCPGPATRDLGDRLRLVLLDTQWWLHGSDRPEDPTSSCPADSKGEITAALREAVAGDPNRHVVVAGHHPLRSGGVHGGKFDWKDHIFPLRAYKNWMWLPLPLIGSLYPLVRGSGISAQDAAAGSNEEMRDSIRAAFDARPPLAYAAGHEHNLQIIAEDSGTILVVSGTGSFDHTSQVFRLGESRYASAASGFIRVDVLRDGRVRIAVIVVDEAGRRSEDFSAWVGSERR